jgi:threonine/homoserine/homoserine lactone efflux protein
MDLLFIVKGIIIGILASVPLGPVGVVCIQRTLNRGRLNGFASGMGAAFADTVFAIVAVLGLSFIINFVEEHQIYFKIIGGVFLVFLGYRIFNTNPIAQIRNQRKSKNNIFEDFLSVFLLTLTNPLAVFIFIAVFASLGILADELNYFVAFYIVLGITLGAALYWFLLATLISAFRKKFRLKSLWWINKISGSSIMIFGLAAFISLFF